MVAAVIIAEDIVIRTINIAAVAPMLEGSLVAAQFIVAVRTQEVALSPGAALSPEAVLLPEGALLAEAAHAVGSR